MNKRTFCIALLTLIIFKLSAQNKEEQLIDNFILESLDQFKEIPSLAIAVIKDGKPFFTKTYGYSNVEDGVNASNQTSYYIASVTKPFVGLLAANLEADGVLNLDESIANYKPIKHFKNKALFENISIRNLLSHTSGIKNNLLSWKYANIGEYSSSSMKKLLEDKTSSSYNNKSFSYDNFGYNVLDIILQDEFGLSWKKLLEKEICVPLEMKHTSAFISKAKKKNWDIALPYAAINDEKLPKLVSTQKNDETFQAAGGVVSSINDMQNFLLMYMNKGLVKDKTVFDESIITTTLSPIAENKGRKGLFQPVSHGLGWNIGKFNEEKVYYHSGGFDGFFSHMSFLPNKNIGIVVLANENHFGDNVSNLITAFTYHLLLGKINAISDYQNEVKKVEARISQLQKAFERDRRKRAKRNWTLMHDFKNYTGIYKNEHIGNLVITVKEEDIEAKLGISKAIASPSANDESIRVEFRNGSGRDILFISNKNGTMAAVYNGYVFLK